MEQDILGIPIPREIYIFILPTVLFSIVFGIFYWKNRARLLNGLLFMIWLMLSAFSIGFILIALNNALLTSIAFIVLAIIMLPILFLIGIAPFILIFGSLLNAWIVYQRERFSLANMLTLFIGLFSTGSFIFSLVVDKTKLPLVVSLCLNYFSLITTYFILHFLNYIVTAIIYRFYRPNPNKDYLIVLGSGLIDGYIVPPLLASRINRAIQFYNYAHTKGYQPKIIFSGGQGADELLSEADAMRLYAVEKGVPITDTLLEDKSTTTYENMLFSKKLITNPTAKLLFFTNNYHVLRAAIYARHAGLKAQGVGSKTALYFLPNAILREFIALIVMYKRMHIWTLGILSALYLLGSIISLHHILY